jgi:DNA-directed RNA polymerase specialized sigma24 family protein
MKLDRGTSERVGEAAATGTMDADGGDDPDEPVEAGGDGEPLDDEDPDGESPPAGGPCAGYERASFDGLYERKSDFVWALLARRVAKRDLAPESAEDIHQGVFLQADLQLQKHVVLENEEAMLVCLLGHQLSNRSRKMREELGDGQVNDSVIAKQRDGEGWVHDADCARMVETILAEMPQPLADLMRRVDLDGERVAAIAVEQGRHVNNVMRQHSRARESFYEIGVRLFGSDLGGIL